MPPPVNCDRTAEFVALVAGRRTVRRVVLSKESQARRAAYQRVWTPGGVISKQQALRVAIELTREAQSAARNDQERCHFCMVEQMLLLEEPPSPARSERLRGIERQLAMVEQLYCAVQTLIAEQGHKLATVERNVNKISLRIDASEKELEDAAPRTFRTKRARFYWWYPRSFPAKIRLAFFFLIAVNLALFYLGYL